MGGMEAVSLFMDAGREEAVYGEAVNPSMDRGCCMRVTEGPRESLTSVSGSSNSGRDCNQSELVGLCVLTQRN